MARSGARDSGFSGSESISVAVNCPRPTTTNPMDTGESGVSAAPRTIWANEKSRRLVTQIFRLRTARSSSSHASLIFATALVTDCWSVNPPPEFLQAGVQLISRIPVIGLLRNDVNGLLEEFQLGAGAVLREKQLTTDDG
jgi:hypothetical protein